ncbi:MAG: hypothetical protein KBD63_07760 [Bacteriovoracaceae bacterium]|nr:hypothetical protein [Bacteriovoracaceae bacterium]
MMNDDVLLAFLDNAAQKALKEIKEGSGITEKTALPLMLKAQFNHVVHLEQDMVTKKVFESHMQDMVTKQVFESRMQDMVTKQVFESRMQDMVTKKEFESRIFSLEQNMVTKLEFNVLRSEIVNLKINFDKFESLIFKVLGFGIGLISLLIGLAKFL